MLDRLRLDDARSTPSPPRSRRPPRSIRSSARSATRTLANGLRVSERRIPIGVVGANFEARPNVALDVAGQLLKSLNAAVLRTGGAALRTVTALVDDVLRPALERAGPAAGARSGSSARPTARARASSSRCLARSRSSSCAAAAETTAALARLAAENGVRTLAHAEGGGVLYVHAAADPAKALALAEASLDRLGVCNRLNLALVDRARRAPCQPLSSCSGARPRGARRRRRTRSRSTRRSATSGPSDPERVATVTVALVDDLDEAVRLANEETSGLAAGIVTEDAAAAARFLDGYRGTAALLARADALHRRLRADRRAGDRDQRRLDVPGPRGPVTYRDLWLRQYRVVGDGTQRR